MVQYSVISHVYIFLIILSGVFATSRDLLFHEDEVNLQCHVCNESYYCLNGVKFHCPLNSLSHSTLANDISDCVCIDGYVMPNTTGLQIGDRCDLGLPPFYYKDGLKFHCLDNKATTFDGASKVTDCVCVPGYAGLVGEAECNICLNGKYTFQANSSSCLQCPLNSFHVLLGATSVKSCQCNAGYTGTIEYSDSICTACPAGKFKDNAGNSTCQECPQNTYSEIAASLCIQCPANSSSEANSNSISDCLCDPGFRYSSLNGGSCEMCLEGTYKDFYENTVCLSCEEGTISSERGSIVCNDCNNNSQSFPLQGGEICKCNAGYIQNNTDLILPVCTPCKANQYQQLSGQTTCVDCPENSLSPIATESATGCLCNDGYYQQDSFLPDCLACAAGTYKEAASTPDQDYLACSLCPINSHSLHTSASLIECICNAGYEGPDGGPCTACVPGKFKSLNGSAACQSCDIHYFSDVPASTICTSCVTFLNSDGAITEQNGTSTSNDCICDLSQGFLEILHEDGKRTCSGCQAGTYATSDGCENCTGGQYADVAGLTACKDCPANSSSYDYPHVACQCHAGYYCAPTMQGAVLPEVSITSIINTNGGRHWPRLYDWDYDTWTYIKSYVDTKCVDLPGYQYSDFYSGSDSYQAGVDFIKNNGPCAANQGGVIYATDEANSVECIFAVAQDGDGNDWLVNVWLYRWYLPPEAQEIYGWPNSDNENGWVYFEFLTEAVLQGNTWSEQLEMNKCAGMWTGAPDIPDWGSIPDYQLTLVLQKEQNTLQEAFTDTCPTGDCVACPVDTFKNYTGGADNCYDCQANSVSDLASVSQDDCECDLGFRQDGPDTCVACLAGHYADTLDSATCTPCGDRFYTAQSDFPWTSVAECTQCQVCSAPTYEDHYDAANNGAGCGLSAPSECVACPTDTSLFDPSTTDNWNAGQESCVCDDNLYGLAGGPCYACPVHSIRNFSDSSSSISDCVCDTGFEPDPALTHECRPCPVNTYKTGPGDYNCTACPATLVTYAEGNVHQDACVCAPGFIYVSNQCEACAANSYKGGYNRHSVCDECRPHSVSASGARESQACQCNAGYELYLDETIVEDNRLYMSVNPNTLISNWEGSGCTNLPTGFPWSYRFRDNSWNLKSLELPCPWIRQWYEEQHMWNFDAMPDWGDKTDDAFPAKSQICEEISPVQQAIPGEYSVPDSPASMACPANTQWWRCEQWRSFRLPVGSDWRKMTIDSYETIHLVYDYCDCCSWHQGNFRIVNIDQGEYVYSQMLGNHPNTSCQACDVGKFKNFTSNVECELCAINTYAANAGSYGCSACESGKSTINLEGQKYCECEAGTERESSDVLSNCQNCAEGKFKTAANYDEPSCQNCSHCGADQQVDTVCDRFQDITCKACQDNSWSTPGRTELGPCFCNSGYELVDSECVACPIGKARTTNYNNSIACETCQDGKFADIEAATECEFCASHCNGTIGGPFGFTGLLGKFVYKTIPFTRVQWISGVGESLGIPKGDQRWQTGTYNNPELVDYGFETSTFEQDAAALWDLLTQNMPECPGDTLPPTDASHPWTILKQAYSADFTTLDQVTSLADDPQYKAQIEPYLNGGQCTYHPPATGVFRPSSDNIAYTNIGKYIIHPIEVPRDPNNPSEKMTLLNVLFYAWWDEDHILDPNADTHVNAVAFQKKWPIYSCTLSPKGWRDFFNERYYNKDPWTKNYVWFPNMIIDHFNLFSQTPNLNYNVIDSNGAQTNDYRQVYFNLGVASSSSQTYVTEECEITRDTVCTACTPCPPGQYAIQSCGIPFNNDRNDTKCAVCPAGYYCPGGVEGAGIDVQPKLCPDEALSEVGSDDISDCICNPGWYRTSDQCEICPYDMYCPGTDQAISCPYPGKTFHVGSTVRLDCHCPRSYYRNPPNDLLGFNCSLCTPNDYCFNNSLFNCTDPLMISDAGSGYFKNCTCIDRFYNDGEVCTQCSVDHYCVDGKEYACPQNEWTNSLPRQAECVCQQGYYRNEGVCIMCPENFYCDGTDDLSRLCPQFSIATNYTSDVSQCLCTKGYGAVYSTNLSEPHTCVRCIDQETFKDSVQNVACEACDICDPILHNTYTNVQCTAETDTSCDACSVCHDPLDPNPRTKYALEVCNVNFDTVCANCTVCDYTQQWHDPAYPCTEQYDRECLPINFERVCPVGEYAGNHTIDKDSECLPCQYHDIYYQGARLHEASTRGLIYNDPYSCEITCLQPSRLRNVSNILQGCKTCETGNVLFKHFTGQSDFECIFDCLPGYEKVMNPDGVDGDCILGALNTDPTHYFNHSINVSHVERVKNQNNAGAYRFTVSHTSHGRFVVLVGQQKPTCTGRERSTKHLTQLDCCMNNLWRVSTKMQMGLDANDVESCTRLPSLWSQKNSANQLQFEIADTEIHNVALCKNDTVGTDCTVTISILDTLTYQVTSVAAKTSMQRGSTFASIGNHHVYIPLSSFKVEMQLAYIDTTSHRPVLVIMSDIAPYEYAGTVNVAVHGTGLTPISPDENVNCKRLQPQQQEYHTHLNNWTLPSNSSRFITTIYMQIPYTTDSQVQVKLIFTLHLVDRGSVVKNIMHIAVWRTVSLTDAICTQAPSPQTINTGLVLGCSGIGSDVVAQSNSATTTTHAVRGEIGSLTSFVAKNLLSDGLGVTMVNILLASALPPATNLLTPEIVNITNGNLDFTNSFKQACFASQACHIQAVYQNLHHWGMFTFSNCNETVKQFAKNWLLSSYGVVNDQGHIDALCNLAHPTTEDKHKFLIALINTRAYLPQDHQWHDLQNRTANFATSVIHALFRFT